jgi:hypothetical protein
LKETGIILVLFRKEENRSKKRGENAKEGGAAMKIKKTARLVPSVAPLDFTVRQRSPISSNSLFYLDLVQ